MTCPRCDGPATTEALREFGGVCAKCLLEFAAERDAPAFPGLEIERVLGEGGMGVVYKAVQKQLGRTVALKVLSPALASDPAFVERFTREAKALAQLSHPNIVAVHESGVHDGVPYLVMEYVEGTPLRKLMAAGKLAPGRALEVVPQLCDALAYAHAHGVVHRDVKPENILIDREGRVKIADFGLAKLASGDETRLTRTRMVMGTPNYMAPEQIENPSTVDHRADIYSLGVVFYEMLTGELPLGRFKAPSEKAPVDARLDPVVLRSLEKDPGDRYQQAGDVRDDVTRVRSAPASPPPAKPRSDLAHACGILLFLALLAFVAAFILPAKIGNLCYVVSGALFLATIVLSFIALVWVLAGRGRLRGAGTAAVTLVVALLALSSLFFLSARPAPSPRPPVRAVVAPPAPAVPARLAQIWPDGSELPAGLSYRSQHEGAEALKQAKLPEELMADLDEARYAILKPGDAELLALRFKSQALEDLWATKPELATDGRRWSRSSWNGDCIKVWIAHGKFPLGSGAVETLTEKVAERLRSPRPAPVRPQYRTRRPIAQKKPFGIAATWPTSEDLQGLNKEQEGQGRKALYEAGLPEEMLQDMVEARRCLFLDGMLELLGLEFKAEIPRARWLAYLGFSSIEESSLSVYVISYGVRVGIEDDAVARAVDRVLRKKIDPSYVPPPLYVRLQPFRVEDAWPKPGDLPEGLSLTDPREGDEAFRAGGLPEESKADVQSIRTVRVVPGNVVLCACEFKTELARTRWDQEPAFQDKLLQLPGGIPAAGGRSLFLIRRDASAPAVAAEKLLVPILERRIREAGVLESKRPRR